MEYINFIYFFAHRMFICIPLTHLFYPKIELHNRPNNNASKIYYVTLYLWLPTFENDRARANNTNI